MVCGKSPHRAVVGYNQYMDDFKKTRDAILSLPRQFDRKNFSVEFPPKRGGKISAIVICGMGGSGISGDILGSLAESAGIPVPVIVHKNYGIPKVPGALYIFVSFSGDTAEVLSGFETAGKTVPKPHIAVATGGGRLLMSARAKKLFSASFSAHNLTPREGIGYTAYAVFLLLQSFFPSIRPTSFFHTRIAPGKLETRAKAVAKLLGKRPLLVYSAEECRVMGKAWKMYVNETGKLPAFENSIPEANHNEIESFAVKNLFSGKAVFLETEDLPPAMKKRFSLTKKILSRAGISPVSVKIPGKTRAERIWNGIVLGNWTGYFLAGIAKANPRETRVIQSFKKALK